MLGHLRVGILANWDNKLRAASAKDPRTLPVLPYKPVKLQLVVPYTSYMIQVSYSLLIQQR